MGGIDAAAKPLYRKGVLARMSGNILAGPWPAHLIRGILDDDDLAAVWAVRLAQMTLDAIDIAEGTAP